MQTPFPGMDPYLEHPALWPDVHNSLVNAIGNAIVPWVAPRYFVTLERRLYALPWDDPVFPYPPAARPISASVDEAQETFLEIRAVESGRLVTILELLSPANKLHPQGRAEYERKREQIFRSPTNLVEVDLLRAGEPMRVIGPPVQSDYRILIRRGSQHLRAYLQPFTVREAIPTFRLPLLPGDEEPEVDLNRVLHELYGRARFDLRLDYDWPAEPPLREADAAWARELLEK